MVPVPLNGLHKYEVGRSEFTVSWKELGLETQTDLTLSPGSSTF